LDKGIHARALRAGTYESRASHRIHAPRPRGGS